MKCSLMLLWHRFLKLKNVSSSLYHRLLKSLLHQNQFLHFLNNFVLNLKFVFVDFLILNYHLKLKFIFNIYVNLFFFFENLKTKTEIINFHVELEVNDKEGWTFFGQQKKRIINKAFNGELTLIHIILWKSLNLAIQKVCFMFLYL